MQMMTPVGHGYGPASPPLAEAEQAQVDAVVDHVNAHHADTVLLVARHLHPGVAEAELAAADAGGATFSGRAADGRTVRTRVQMTGYWRMQVDPTVERP